MFDGSTMKSAFNTLCAISKRRSQDGVHKWEWSLGPPKSRKSLRGISGTDSVMRLLADLKVGNADSGFIFPGNYHGFIDPDRFESDICLTIVKEAELTRTRFHDLRNFFASLLIANGETAAYVRDQTGTFQHVTFDTYGHLLAEGDKPAIGTKNPGTQPAGNLKPLLAIG
jgi:hypothetical protein